MTDELLVDVLKSYVPIKDWDLHNWDLIISRREKYKADVWIYHLVYADIYLTTDLEFYSVEPKQPNYSFIKNNNSNDDLLIDVLKSYVPSKDWDLHNWSEIIYRREHYKNDVFIYKLVYADIYLDENLGFYDVEPKQPNNAIIKRPVNEESRLIIDVLSNYIPYEYCSDVDWDTVLSRVEKIKYGCYKYKINNIEFYLDNELNPVEYGRVHIINNKIYYDFGLNPKIEYAPLIYFSDV